ncbi:hypothetical protein P692DRAFT_20891782 [Suillus brevipes Sb2]|nr:hypothetical protein P692DRAFT_20891782 [Suillus brevipes Sb2]
MAAAEAKPTLQQALSGPDAKVARTAARIALTFLPLILFKKKYFKHHEIFHPGVPVDEKKKAAVLKRIRARTLVVRVLLFVPVISLFWLAILASAEQTPIKGQWRLIILSPEEEDEIAAQLKCPSWYHAASEILLTDGPPKLISTSNWRYQWYVIPYSDWRLTFPHHSANKS